MLWIKKNGDLPALWLDDLCVVCAWLPYLAVRAANNTLRHIWEERLRLCKQHRHIVPVRRSSPRGLTSLSVHRRKGEPSRTCTDAANAATPPRTLLKSQIEISFATISCNDFKLSLVTVTLEEKSCDAKSRVFCEWWCCYVVAQYRVSVFNNYQLKTQNLVWV